jgi:hypothetical protein
MKNVLKLDNDILVAGLAAASPWHILATRITVLRNCMDPVTNTYISFIIQPFRKDLNQYVTCSISVGFEASKDLCN